MTFSYGFIFFISNLVGTIVGVLFLVLSLHFFKNKDSHKKLIPIKCVFFFLIILEIIKIMYLISATGEFKPKSYPIIYCSCAMYFYFIIGFIDKDCTLVRIAKGNMIFVFLVMGFLYYVSFPGLDRTGNLEALFLNTHSRLYHILLFYVAIYMIVTKLYDFRLKDCIPVGLFNASYFTFCTILSIFIGGEISNFGPESVELYWFYDIFGYATGNILLGIIAIFLSILCYLFVLGIKKINKKRIEQKNNRQIDIH